MRTLSRAYYCLRTMSCFPRTSVGSFSRALAAALVVLLAAFSAMSVPAFADSKSQNPFDGPVGGKQLGNKGVVIDPESAVPAPPEVAMGSYVIADLDTGQILAAKNAHQRLRPASTLKALTALTLLPRLDKRARYTAVRQDADMIGSKVGLEAGNVYTIDQLFYGLFLQSGNDAAMALANASGGVKATVSLMNAEAARLGAFDTHAVTPEGLDEDGQLSSAYDLALFGREGVLNHPDFAAYCKTQTYAFPGRKGKTFQIQNTNKLLMNGRYPGTFGVKNGYTTLAKNTLIAAVERNGKRLLISAMGIESPSYDKVEQLFDWGFTAAGQVEAVGQLVSPVEVAAAVEAKSPKRTQTSQTDSPEDSTDIAGNAPSPSTSNKPVAAPEAGFNLATTRLAGLPLWLWAAAVLFFVMAGARVITHVRSRARDE
jgi:serine-type D-Ala-D-Ala carboxypeptidase (penicillin-binding protein 5/6)